MSSVTFKEILEHAQQNEFLNSKYEWEKPIERPKDSSLFRILSQPFDYRSQMERCVQKSLESVGFSFRRIFHSQVTRINPNRCTVLKEFINLNIVKDKYQITINKKTLENVPQDVIDLVSDLQQKATEYENACDNFIKLVKRNNWSDELVPSFQKICSSHPEISKDKAFLLKLLSLPDRNIHRIIKYFDPTLEKDLDFCLECIKTNFLVLELYPNKKTDEEFMLKAITANGLAIFYASDRAKKHKQLALIAISNQGLAFQYLDKSLKDDKEIAIKAVQQNGYALQHFSKIFRDDEDVLLAAVKQNGLAIELASDALKRNKKIVLAAVSQNGLALKYVYCFNPDKEAVLEAIKQSKDAIFWVDKAYMDDSEIAMAAVCQDGLSYHNVSMRLKNDPDIILEAFLNNPLALTYTPDFDDSLLNKLTIEQKEDLRKLIRKELASIDKTKLPYSLLPEIDLFLAKKRLNDIEIRLSGEELNRFQPFMDLVVNFK